MSRIEDYDIKIFNLSNAKHEFDFTFDRSFFSLFENSLLEEGEGQVQVTIDKSERLLNVSLQIDGHIALESDRTLRKFDFPLTLNEKIVYKYGSDPSLTTDDIIIISPNEEKINLAKSIYEFITLAIPMKKLHPDESEEPIAIRDETEEEDTGTEKIDPRWEALKKLNN